MPLAILANNTQKFVMTDGKGTDLQGNSSPGAGLSSGGKSVIDASRKLKSNVAGPESASKTWFSVAITGGQVTVTHNLGRPALVSFSSGGNEVWLDTNDNVKFVFNTQWALWSTLKYSYI